MIRSREAHDKSLLAKLYLFKNVSLESIEVYLEQCEFGTLSPGEILLSPHQENKNIFLLLDGQLTVHLDSQSSSPLISLESGECVGEMSIIEKDTPSAFVVAAEESRVLIIDQQTLWSFIKASHEVARNLLYLLSRRVREGNIALGDIPELQSHYKQNSVFDALTGLYNRRWLDEMFERILRRCAMSKNPLSLVLSSIDHFKDFNARHGSLAGDLALCAYAGTLRKNIRPNDLAARFSGEQFALVLPETRLKEAVLITERVKDEVAKTRINVEGKFNLTRITASFGISEMKPHDTLESIIVDANAALDRAVGLGGNSISQ